MLITAIKGNICKIKCVYYVQVLLVELANFNSIFSENFLKRQKLRTWKIQPSEVLEKRAINRKKSNDTKS